MRPYWKFVLSDAERMHKAAMGGHTYTRSEYEGAMLDLAEAEAGQGESVASALSRLWAENDPRIAALHKAAGTAPMLRRTGSRAGVVQVMNDYTAKERTRGETHEQAFDRLLATDGFMKGMYAVYCEAAP